MIELYFSRYGMCLIKKYMFYRYHRYAQQNRQHQSNPDWDGDVAEVYYKSGDLDTEIGYKEICNWKMCEWLIFYCLWWDQRWINTRISAFAKNSGVHMCAGTLLLRKSYLAGIFHFTWETRVSSIFFVFSFFFFQYLLRVYPMLCIRRT